MRSFLICSVVAVLSTASTWAQLNRHKDSIAAGAAVLQGPNMVAFVSAGIPEAGSFVGPANRGWLGFYPIDTLRTTSVNDGIPSTPTVHPNPALYRVMVPITGVPVSIEVLDADGHRCAVPYTIAAEAELDVRSLAAGAYSVVARYPDRVQRFRFIVRP